jgi:predicted phage tail protein
MITVSLEGELADIFTDKIELAIQSIAELMRALKANFSNFLNYLQQAEKRGVMYRIVVGYEDVHGEKLYCPISKKVRSIRIIPVISGSGDNWWMWIGAAALFTLAIVAPGGVLIWGTKFFTSNWTILMGSVLLFAGIASLFKPAKEEPEKSSETFGGIQSNTQEGGRVPIIYGIMISGFYVISAKISSVYIGNPVLGYNK